MLINIHFMKVTCVSFLEKSAKKYLEVLLVYLHMGKSEYEAKKMHLFLHIYSYCAITLAEQSKQYV